MKLVLMCHQHPDQPSYHVLLRSEDLDPLDYRSRCFVQFVDSADSITECPRCGAVHRHDQEVPA